MGVVCATECETTASMVTTEKCCDADKPLTAQALASSSFSLQVVEDKAVPSGSAEPVALQTSTSRYLK